MLATVSTVESKGSQCSLGITQAATQTEATSLVSASCQTGDVLPDVQHRWPAGAQSTTPRAREREVKLYLGRTRPSRDVLTVRQPRSTVPGSWGTLPNNARQVIRLKGVTLRNAGPQTYAAPPVCALSTSESEIDPLHAAVCCVECCKLFGRRYDADRHWWLCHAAQPAEEPQRPHQCSYCPYLSHTVPHRMDVLQHEKLHTREELYACRFYQHPIYSSSYVCSVCQKSFSRSGCLVEQERVHTRGQYICVVCSEPFSWKNCLSDRLKTPTGGKPYRCRLCPQYWYRQSDRDIHEGRHLSGEVPHVCRVCQKHFSRKQYLASRPFVCDICQKGFARKTCLAAHGQKTHADKKPIILRLCPQPWCRQNHYNVPHICGICHRHFARKQYLTAHERIHTGERPFVCGICHKTFARKSRLVAHGRTHSGEELSADHSPVLNVPRP